MKQIVLNATGWQSKDDVYDAFFRAVGAPEWHGRNLDALNDSIGAGQINQVEVPYRLVIKNYHAAGYDARKTVDGFVRVIEDLVANGCPVAIQVLQKI